MLANGISHYTTTRFESVAKDMDVVLDAVGGDTLARACAIMEKGGIVVSLRGQRDAAEVEEYGIRGVALFAKPNGAQLAEITNLIDAKVLKPFVSETLPLTAAAKATAQAETHHSRGKLVLLVADDAQKKK